MSCLPVLDLHRRAQQTSQTSMVCSPPKTSKQIQNILEKPLKNLRQYIMCAQLLQT